MIKNMKKRLEDKSLIYGKLDFKMRGKRKVATIFEEIMTEKIPKLMKYQICRSKKLHESRTREIKTDSTQREKG